MPESDDMNDIDVDSDEDPIPAKRDTRIFQRETHKKGDDEDYEEDVFV